VTALSTGDLPAAFVAAVAQHRADPARPADIDGNSWLRTLPRLVDEALDRWTLRVDHGLPLRWGFTALVVPVTRPKGDPGVLKVTWPHEEADTEHLALRAWKGRGAVRLLAADPASGTLLLERLDEDRDLTSGGMLDTSEALGRLLSVLDRPAPPWAPALSTQLAVVADRLTAAAGAPEVAHRFPRRMLQQAASLASALQDEDALDARLVHTDLHHANVLWRPDPGEWAAIDPKTVAGDPHWGVAPAVWNRWSDALAAPDLRSHLLLRVELICGAAGLDADRARAMTIVRVADNALWSLRHGRDDLVEEITRSVAIIKAMQPG
jgi:streptomycin 6-kinase